MRKVHQCLYMYMLYTHSIIMSVRLHVSLCVLSVLCYDEMVIIKRGFSHCHIKADCLE